MKFKGNLASVFDAISLPVMLVDRNYAVVDMNRAAASHRGLARDGLTGHSCFKLTHDLGEPCWRSGKVLCPVKQAFESGERVRTIHKHRIDGRLVVEEIVATPLEQDDRRIEYVIEEFRDVTALLDLRDGVLSICSSCKRIRDEKGNWQHIEGYIRDRTGADFSHSFCPECFVRLYPGFEVGNGRQ